MAGVPLTGKKGHGTFEEKCRKCGYKFTVTHDRFKDKEYINWLKGTLCLQYAKEGLEDFVDRTSAEYHGSITKQIFQAYQCPNQCDIEQFRSEKFQCPGGICNVLKTTLQVSSTERWRNTTIEGIKTSPNELAKLYMPVFCSKQYDGPKKADCTAILNLMYDCPFFWGKIDNSALVEQVLHSRNDIMHSGTMRLDDKSFLTNKNKCVMLLSDSGQLKNELRCSQAIANIEELCGHEVKLQLLKVESHVLNQLDQQKKSEITCLKQTIESNKEPADSLREIKEKLRERGEEEAKLSVLMEVYNIDSSHVTNTVDRKTDLSRLYRKADEQLEQAHEDQMREQLEHAHKQAHEDQLKEKDVQIGRLQKNLSLSQHKYQLREKLEHAQEYQLREKEYQIAKLQKDLDLSQRNVLLKITMHEIGSDFVGTDVITIQEEGKQNRQTPEPATTQVGDICVRTEVDTDKCWITGSSLLPSNRLILVDNNNDNVKLVNLQTSRVTTELKTSSKPWDITSISGDTVAVTVPRSRKIVIVNVTDQLRLDRELPVDGQCRAVVHSNGNLIVSYTCTWPSKIEIMSLDGKATRKIAHSVSFKYPHYMALSENNKALYVSDYGGGCVTRLSLDGAVEATYKDRELFLPRGVVCVGQHGRLLVCGYGSGNIHLLEPGLTQGKLLLQGIGSPHSLSYCHNTGRLYVGMSSDNIKVFQLSQEPS